MAHVLPTAASALAAPKAPGVLFDAMLTPHRSLNRRGFIILMSLVAGVSFIAGMAFLLMGAWPVFGFFGLDVALIYLAFRLNYRAARAHETVQLSANELRVRSVSARGEVRGWSFQPYWVRVSCETGPEGVPDEDSQVVLASHG